MLTSLLLGLAAMGAQAGLHGFIMPPKAVREGAIREVQLSPIFAEDFTCSQHFAGQIPYAGDDLGSDCMITGGVEGKSGYSRFFRTDGRTDADWYGWNAPVLSPTDGIVAGIVDKGGSQCPGHNGTPARQHAPAPPQRRDHRGDRACNSYSRETRGEGSRRRGPCNGGEQWDGPQSSHPRRRLARGHGRAPANPLGPGCRRQAPIPIAMRP